MVEFILQNRIASSLALSALVIGTAGTAQAADILVGPTRAIKTLSAAVIGAKPGDRVLLDAGTYLDDTADVNVPMTIEGAGAGATLSMTRNISNGKGIIVTNADVTLRNLTLQGAKVVDANGAGIRLQSGAVTVDNVSFVNNQNGILTNTNPAATLTITGSRFTGNGSGTGYTHAIYANEIGQLTVTGSTFSAQNAGHNIKSRALKTTVIQTVIDDGVTGSSAYAIDLSNGGVGVIDGVTITQGSKTQNPAMIGYGSEGSLKAANSLTVRNSGFTNQLSSPSSSAVYNFTTTVNASLIGNTFTNVAMPLRGPGTISTAAATASATMRQASVFSTAQADTTSYLRFFNTGSGPGAVTVNLYNASSGTKVGEWQSPSIPANASLQVPVSTLEATITGVATKPQFYALGVAAGFTGTFQHIAYRPAPGVFSNLSNCDTGLTTNAGKLSNVNSSLLDSTYASSLVFYNAGGTAASASVGVFDAKTGARLGTYTTPSIAPGTQVVIASKAVEAGAGVTPSTAVKEYTLKVESAFTGTVQHLVSNQAAGVLTDMTASCPLK
jgi:hypothetical protein